MTYDYRSNKLHATTSRNAFATGIFISIAVACVIRKASAEDEKIAAINVVLAHEKACETYDLEKLDSMHTVDSRGIEESYPEPTEPGPRQFYQLINNAGVHIDYHPEDAVAQVRGDVAWVTVTLHSLLTADNPAPRAMIGGEWHVAFVKSSVLVRTPARWKITLGHTSSLPAEFGA
jgi:SnoaL-like domain